MSEAAALTPQELFELGLRCWRSPPEYARIVHPDWFPSKMPWVHRGLCALRTGSTEFLLDFGPEWWPEDIARGEPSYWTLADLIKIVTNFVITVEPAKRDSDGKIIVPEKTKPIFALDLADDGKTLLGVRIINPQLDSAYIMPRGFSKTTLINMLNERDIVYQAEKFILYVSETLPHASAQVRTIRRQLETNSVLRLMFGNLVPERMDSDKWTDSLIEPTNGTRVAALGSGGQVRGINIDADRPSRIVVDDFQSKEGVKSPTQRTNDVEWFIATLVPARKLFGTGITHIDVIGTLLHPEAVMAYLMVDPDWQSVRFGAIDRQGDYLWAYAVDGPKLEKLKAQFIRLGQAQAFDYEYMSDVPLDDGVAFPVDKIKFNIIRPSEWFVAKALVCDPAISDDPKADFFSLAAMGIGKYGDVNVIDFFGEVGVEFSAQAEKIFEFHFAHMLDIDPANAHHGIEAIAYQQALVSLVMTKQHEFSRTWGQRAFFEVIPILHGKTGKNVRVQGLLSPRVRSGHVEFSRHFPTLENQLHNWGQRGAKKDGPDVLAMGIRLLDPYAPLSGNIPGETDPDDPDAIPEPMAGYGATPMKLPPLRRTPGAP